MLNTATLSKAPRAAERDRFAFGALANDRDFASAERFMNAFDFKAADERITIDLHQAHFWGITSVAALDKIVIKFRREGAMVSVTGMNEATRTVVDKFGVYDNPENVEKLLTGH